MKLFDKLRLTAFTWSLIVIPVGAVIYFFYWWAQP